MISKKLNANIVFCQKKKKKEFGNKFLSFQSKDFQFNNFIK